MFLYFVGSAADDGVHLFAFGDGQSQMSAGYGEAAVSLHEAEACHSGVGAGRLEKLEMLLRGYVVEHHAGDVYLRVEVAEAVDQWSHAVGGRLGVDDEDDGQMERDGNFGAASAPAVVAVEKPHHSFHHGGVGIFGVCAEELSGMVGGCHEGVYVHALVARGDVVEHGVDIVGAALEGLHAEPPVGKGAEQAHGEGGLAAV